MGVTFFFMLAGGTMLVLATGRTDQIAWQFLRLVSALVLAITCVTSLWCMPRSDAVEQLGGKWIFAFGAASAIGASVVVFAAPFARRMSGVFRLICLTSGLAALVAGQIAAIRLLGQESRDPIVTAVTLASQAFGALLIGSITVAWLLGHAYLTATKMTIAPLRHFSRLLSLAVTARIGFLIFSLVLAWFSQTDTDTSVLSHLGQAWLILTLRIVVGLLSVGLFAYMVSDCVRLRSTQSATGILYFGSVFAYVGELANLQLISQYGWPL